MFFGVPILFLSLVAAGQTSPYPPAGAYQPTGAYPPVYYYPQATEAPAAGESPVPVEYPATPVGLGYGSYGTVGSGGSLAVKPFKMRTYSGPDPLKNTRTPECDPNGKGTALMIIDMQDHFILRNKQAMTPRNAKAITSVVAEQKRAIELAKRTGTPIILVEYAPDPDWSGATYDFGTTTSELKDAVGTYDKASVVRKSTDGVFDPFNTYRQELATVLRKHDVKNLIVAGSNGSACVAASIQGALAGNCKVTAFNDGLADFNFERFITPYIYDQSFLNNFRQAAQRCLGCSMNQADALDDLKPLMPVGATANLKPAATVDPSSSR